VLVLREGYQRSHVFDELLKTAGPKSPEFPAGFAVQAMTPVIVSVNDKFSVHQGLG